MYSYQDLLKNVNNERDKANAAREIITRHQNSGLYKTAVVAEEYMCHRNMTIREYQKFLYTVSGKTIPDTFSPNYKMACRHFYRFITQENQYLLGNGVSWDDESVLNKIETEDYPFDNQLQEAGREALVGGVSFGFFNNDHIEVFNVREFAPVYDELDGSLKAGVRFWQVDPQKPLCGILYEIDGYTQYVWYTNPDVIDDTWEKLDEGIAYRKKKAYKYKVKKTELAGEIVRIGENYPEFPIVPFWGNAEHQSEIVGLREQIDCYDLIKNGLANDQDEASLIYWTLTNAGGMGDADLTKFVERLKTIHAATIDEEVTAESHTVEAPYQGREAILDRIDRDMYRDAMALDVDRIAGGAVTATQIEAAYELLTEKADLYEYQALNFIKGILKIAGVKAKATFTRSQLVNRNEDVQTVVGASAELPSDYVTKKIMTTLGDGDKADEAIAQMEADEMPTIDE